MIVELTRFRVLPGAEERAKEWIDFLRDHPQAFEETLEPEQMYVETTFRPVDLTMELTAIPQRVRKAMKPLES